MRNNRFRSAIGVSTALAGSILCLPAESHDVHYTGRAIGAFGTITAGSLKNSIDLADVPMSCSGTAREETVSTASNPEPLGVRAMTIDAYAIGRDNVAATKASIEDLHLSLPGLKVDATGLTSHAEANCDENTLRITTTGGADVGSLFINGQGQAMSGQPNQVFPIDGVGSVTVNEQQHPTYRELRVWALHVHLDNSSYPAGGDLYFAQSDSKITCSSTS